MKKTKDQVQVEAEYAINQNNGRGIIAMATGTGKSKVAINYIANKQESNIDLRVLIVVPTEKLRDVSWRDEFHKWGQDFIWNNNIERSCYASISKLEGECYDIVILDEGHNITPNNSKFFEQNTVGDLVLLTATPPNKLEKILILQDLGLKVIYEVTLDEAVEWGLVSPYAITIVELSLDSVRKNVKAGSKLKPFYSTELNNYVYLSRCVDNSLGEKKMMYILKRMRFIYTLNSKFEAAQFLLKHIIPKEQRTLIFAGGIEQAEKLCEYTYHSKSKSSTSYDAFLNQEINQLACVEALNEGQNIPNLDNGLIVQLNSNALDLVQRLGRIVRYRNGHLAQIYILVVKGTVDANWLNKAIQGLDRTRIEYLDYSLLKLNVNGNQSNNQNNIQTV